MNKPRTLIKPHAPTLADRPSIIRADKKSEGLTP